jgi:hypothetical protein
MCVWLVAFLSEEPAKQESSNALFSVSSMMVPRSLTTSVLFPMLSWCQYFTNRSTKQIPNYLEHQKALRKEGIRKVIVYCVVSLNFFVAHYESFYWMHGCITVSTNGMLSYSLTPSRRFNFLLRMTPPSWRPGPRTKKPACPSCNSWAIQRYARTIERIIHSWYPDTTSVPHPTLSVS